MAKDIAWGRYPARYGVHLSNVISRVSWGAVWAGFMIALGMEALLSLFGLFVGFGMFNWKAANPGAGIAAWTTIWYFVTVGWSMFFGAWCAARLSGNPVREAGILHGITTWGLTTIVSIAVLALGSWSALRTGVDVLSTAAIATAQVAPSAINQTPPSQLSQTERQAGQTMTQLQQNAGPAAQATAHAISKVALGGWIGLLIGFITAILGGLAGLPRSVVIEEQRVPAGPGTLAA